MKKIIAVIISVICLLLIIGFAVYYRMENKTKFNDDYVNGNTAGNLYNSGLFCEKDGKVYFSNSSDGNKLYCMNPDGSDVEKLSDDSVAYINADDNYIYYVKTSTGTNASFSFLNINTNSLCRLRRDGKGNAQILDSAPSLYASLVGNYIYYLHYDEESATTLYRVKIDATDKTQVNTVPYFTCATNGPYIYYNGVEYDHNIYQYDTSTATQSLLYQGNCWMPVISGSSVYFMDCDNNYKLAKADLSTGEKTILCDDRIDCYNIYGSYIYFARSSSEPALCRMRTDGSEYEELKSGVYTQINITADYVYFRDYFTGIMYRVPTIEGGTPEVFQP